MSFVRSENKTMAEITLKPGKKALPRIDLTPMVDLGFLLITFFVFTTSLNEPRGMTIQMPAEGDGTAIGHHVAMTVLLGPSHQLLYLTGEDALNEKWELATKVGFQNTGFRKALQDHQQFVQNAIKQGLRGAKPDDQAFILIKPGQESKYEDLISALDELQINGIYQYALMDISPREEAVLKNRI
jgi:biopolymer transport protein ExbD